MQLSHPEVLGTLHNEGCIDTSIEIAEPNKVNEPILTVELPPGAIQTSG
jgi:hypothetical protein